MLILYDITSVQKKKFSRVVKIIENSSIVFVTLLPDGTRHGLYRRYYIDGRFKLFGNFDNGAKSGIWKQIEFYTDGMEQIHIKYSSDIPMIFLKLIDGKWESVCIFRYCNAPILYNKRFCDKHKGSLFFLIRH